MGFTAEERFAYRPPARLAAAQDRVAASIEAHVRIVKRQIAEDARYAQWCVKRVGRTVSMLSALSAAVAEVPPDAPYMWTPNRVAAVRFTRATFREMLPYRLRALKSSCIYWTLRRLRALSRGVEWCARQLEKALY